VLYYRKLVCLAFRQTEEDTHAHHLSRLRQVRQVLGLDARRRPFGSRPSAEPRVPEEARRSWEGRHSGPEAGGRRPQGCGPPVPRKFRPQARSVPAQVRHGGQPTRSSHVGLGGRRHRDQLGSHHSFDESRAFHLYDINMLNYLYENYLLECKWNKSGTQKGALSAFC